MAVYIYTQKPSSITNGNDHTPIQTQAYGALHQGS